MSYRRDFSIYRKEEVLFQLKIRGAIEKFKNQPRPLLRPRYVNFSQHFWNPSRKTVPLICQNGWSRPTSPKRSRSESRTLRKIGLIGQLMTIYKKSLLDIERGWDLAKLWMRSSWVCGWNLAERWMRSSRAYGWDLAEWWMRSSRVVDEI
jgi:hypothetical protein